MKYQATTKNEIDINVGLGNSSSSNFYYKYKHDELLNRSKPNQHPASAISYKDITVEDALDLIDTGNFRIVNTLVDRDNITGRSEGMLCYVKEDKETYQLITGISNQAWVPFNKKIQDQINSIINEIEKINSTIESNKNIWLSIGDQ